MFNAQIPFTRFCFLYVLFCFLNTPVKNNKKCSPSLNIYILLKNKNNKHDFFRFIDPIDFIDFIDSF